MLEKIKDFIWGTAYKYESYKKINNIDIITAKKYPNDFVITPNGIYKRTEHYCTKNKLEIKNKTTINPEAIFSKTNAYVITKYSGFKHKKRTFLYVANNPIKINKLKYCHCCRFEPSYSFRDLGTCSPSNTIWGIGTSD